MTDVISCDVLVVGAGVLGLACAAELGARGRDVRVVDPGGPNASFVAAGMVAPALESALETEAGGRAALLLQARNLWPAFAARHGLCLDQSPAEWRGPDAPEIAERLTGLGFAADLAGHGGAVLVADDWRVDPGASLTQLKAGLPQPGLKAWLVGLDPGEAAWRARTTVGEVHAASVVLATGAEPPATGLPRLARDRLAMIQPIRGQIGFTRTPLTAHVVRGRGGYVAPARGGAVLGANMIPGDRDLSPRREEALALIETVNAFMPLPIDLEIEWRVGVRGAAPDGLPLAGPAGEPGLFIAAAPRRNGWLLAPAVARTVAAAIEGRTDPLFGSTFDPSRFDGSRPNPPAG